LCKRKAGKCEISFGISKPKVGYKQTRQAGREINYKGNIKLDHRVVHPFIMPAKMGIRK
jgi:hypothetical protein